MKPFLSVSKIAHSFGGLAVLRNVEFDLQKGDLVGLIGPNGSGKTTLFNILTGFLKPQAGSIELEGRSITETSVQERSRLGLVRTFQTPKVFERMSVIENVMAGCYKTTRTDFLQNLLMTPGARREKQLVREKAEYVCETFGLTNVRHALAGGLPAGQRRNLELARAYAGEPRMLLLDEPSSGLSAGEIEHLAYWLRELNGQGLTILLVSHDMDLMEVTGKVHVLYFGEFIASGPMAQIQRNPAVREAYLGA